LVLPGEYCFFKTSLRFNMIFFPLRLNDIPPLRGVGGCFVCYKNYLRKSGRITPPFNPPKGGIGGVPQANVIRRNFYGCLTPAMPDYVKGFDNESRRFEYPSYMA
jgi:hypothetical protein